jgi:uncharacterized protein (TIGR03437 family)
LKLFSTAKPPRRPLWLAAAFLLAKAACGQDVVLDPAGNIWRLSLAGNGLTCGVFWGMGMPDNLPCTDAIVTKLDPTATKVLFTKTLGGSGNSGGIAIASDSAGDIYIAGYTTARNFPVTSGALQGKNAGPYSSQTDQLSVIPGGDVFVVKLNPDGSLAYSTFLGGSGNDVPTAMSVDGAGSVYVAGTTSSTNFPVTSSPISKTASAGFVAKINPGGKSLGFATYFPAYTAALTVDSAGAAYLAGSAGNTLLTTSGAFQRTFGSGQESFAAKISATGSLIYYSYLGGSGGSGSNSAFALAVDSRGAAWIGGVTGSETFPGLKGTGGAFLVKLAPDGSALQTGSRFGPYSPAGSSATAFVAVDAEDNVYASGFMFPPTGPFSVHGYKPPGFDPTKNAQLSTPCSNSGANFLIEEAADGTPLYVSYLRQNGPLSVTAPGHVLIYDVGVSPLDLTSTPTMNFQCPVNSASYQPPLAPGEIVSLFGYGLGPEKGVAGEPDADGRFPISLSGVEVQFNGVAAPLLWVQAGLINTVVPQNMIINTVQVSYRDRSAPPLDVSGQVANPGVFVVANQDWTVNSRSNPAASGSTIYVYATGMDLAGVNFPNGQLVPRSPLVPFNFSRDEDAVLFDGTPGTILWAGAAPGLIFGVAQINVQLPASLAATAPFTSVPMVVQSISYSSPPFTVFVK